MSAAPKPQRDILLERLTWLVLFVATLIAWGHYLSLPAESKPDRLVWINVVVHAGFALCLIALVALPVLAWRRSSALRFAALQRLFQATPVYGVLLAAVITLASYDGPYYWLFPPVHLAICVVLALVVLWLLYRRDRLLYRPILWTAVWGVCLLLSHETFTAVAGNTALLPPHWWHGPAAETIYGAAFAALALLSLVWIVPGAERRAERVAARLAHLPLGVFVGLFGLTAASLALYVVLNDETQPLQFLAPFALTLLSFGAAGLLAIRFEPRILAALAPWLRSTPIVLQTIVALALASIPWIAPNALEWEMYVPHRYTNMLHFPPVITRYLFDYPLTVFLVALLLLIALDREYRVRLGRCVRSIGSQLGGIWWVCIVLWMAISAVWAISGVLALYTAARLAWQLLAALVLADLVRRGWLRGLLLAFMAGAAAQGLLALAQIFTQGAVGLQGLGEIDYRPSFDVYRATGLTIHPNNLAIFLTLALVAGLLLVNWDARQNRSIRWAALGLVLIALGIVATGSRTNLAVSGIGVLVAVVALRQIRLRILHANRRLLLLAGFALIVGLVALLALTDIATRIPLAFLSTESLVGRLTHRFADTNVVIDDAPVIGVGAGNVMLGIDRLWTHAPDMLYAAFNAFLIVWAELGIVGVALYLFALLAVLARLHPGNGGEVITAGYAFLAAWGILAVDLYYRDPRTMMLVLWMLGLWWGYGLRRADEQAIAETVMPAAIESVSGAGASAAATPAT